jgi:hypothetical protein
LKWLSTLGLDFGGVFAQEFFQLFVFGDTIIA